MRRWEFIAALEQAPKRLSAGTSGLNAAQLKQRPGSGEWSVIELVCHLRDYAEIFDSRIASALSEDSPEVASYDNEDMVASREYESQDLATVLAAHRAIRERMLAKLATLTEAQWQRTVRHATWGQPTLEWLMNRCAEHELEHLADIEAVRRELGQGTPGLR
ncbi:MAG TPA: DinB family protein [Dehalococcoidia bacterium]|jgi:uncharacterized damage-inducible protein DinB